MIYSDFDMVFTVIFAMLFEGTDKDEIVNESIFENEKDSSKFTQKTIPERLVKNGHKLFEL